MKPVLCYESVTWTLTQMTEMEILRIYGPIQDKGCWHPRWNRATYNIHIYLSIVDDIKIRRTEGAGHVIRMEEENIPKKVLNGKCHNKRPVGKSRRKWEGVIQRDKSQILGIRGCSRQAEHREEWRHILREARPRGSSSATERWKDGLDAMLCHCASGSQHFERTHTAT